MKRLMVVALATTLAITGCSSLEPQRKKFKRERGRRLEVRTCSR